MSSDRLLSRMASLGLILVMAALAVFVIWSEHRNRLTIEQMTQRAHAIALVRQARLALTSEVGFAREYWLESNPVIPGRIRLQGATLRRMLIHASSLSAPAQAQQIAPLLGQSRRLDAQMQTFVQATQRQRARQARSIEDNRIEPLAGQMQASLSRVTAAQDQQTRDAETTLQQWQARLQTVTAAVFLIGIALLGLFIVLLRSYQCRAEREAAALGASEARFRALTEHSTDLVVVLDAEGRTQYASPSHASILGYTPDQIRTVQGVDLVHPDDLARAQTVMRPHRNAGLDVMKAELRVRHVDGSWHTLEMVVNNRLDDPDIRGLIVNSRDITERVQAEEALRADRERLRGIVTTQQAISQAALNVQGVMDLVVERARALVRADGAAVEMVEDGVLVRRAASGTVHNSIGLRLPLDSSLSGLAIRQSIPVRCDDAATDHRVDQAVYRLQGMRSMLAVPLACDGRPLGVLKVVSVRAGAFRDGDEDTLALLSEIIGAALNDAATLEAEQALVAERTAALEALREREEQLVHQALHDPLTDLPNRTLVHDRLEQAIKSARRDGRMCALLLLDLDRFKEVNDTFGHHHGDLLLHQAALRLRSAVRESDIVGRLGGDEFAVLADVADKPGAVRVAQTILQAFNAPFTLDDYAVDVDTSIGIALFPVHGQDAPTLLRRADVAMYAAKRAQRGYMTYAPDHDDNSPARLALIRALREAIGQGALELHYQPKIELASGAVAGVEALVRWRHPEHGLVPPAHFVPLAEQTGLIQPLSVWVAQEAARQCAEWQKIGLRTSVALNISAQNIRDGGLVDTLTGVLERSGVDPGLLCVEITETAVMENRAAASSLLERLRAAGIRVAIDDFGTGYSSLAALRDLPVDEIKVDRSFIADMERRQRDTAIVQAVISLGHSLGLLVVAEGIENRNVVERLASCGCDIGQGYFVARPMPAEQCTAWLQCHVPAPATLHLSDSLRATG